MKKISRSISPYLLIAAMIMNLLLPVSAGAAEVPAGQDQTAMIKDNIITSVVMKDSKGNNITDVRPEQGSRVEIYFDWKLPDLHGYKSGSKFVFQLPDKFKLDRHLTESLDGGVGTFEVTPEGQVTLLFNEEIEDNHELTGYFYVWREFDQNKFQGSTNQEIIFQFADDQTKIPVHFKGKSNQITKQGTPEKAMNPKNITWTVDFNLGENPIHNAVFHDVLPAGLNVDLSSVELLELIVNLDGSVAEGSPVPGIKPKAVSDGFEVNLGDIHTAYRINYTTPVTNTLDATYQNKATVTGDDLAAPLEQSASVKTSFTKPLSKSVEYFTSQRLEWTVEYNYNEQDIEQANAWLKDSYDKTLLEFKPGSLKIYEMLIQEDGSAVQKTGKPIKEDEYMFKETTEGFEIHFNKKISSAYKIVYSTQPKDRIYNKETATNKAEMYGTLPVSISKTMKQYIFDKDPGKINYADKTIEWIIVLNRDRLGMDNVVIQDTYKGQGLTLLPDTLEIVDEDSKKVINNYSLSGSDQYNEGFVITFNGSLKGKTVVKYKTKFDSSINSSQYKNKARVTFNDKNGTHAFTESETATPDDYTKNNGNKTGEYNAKTKEITWTIDVNYNLYPLKDAVVRDFYSAGQTFVDGSLSVHHLSLTGGADGVQPGAEVSSSQYTFQKQTADGEAGFEIGLGEITSAYRITYKTTLEGQRIGAEYKNKATMGERGSSPTFQKSAVVSPPYGNELMHKTGKQGTGADQDFANWQLYINRSQSEMDPGTVVTDTLSANQIVVKDSFKLYTTVVTEEGTLAKGGLADAGDYTIEAQDTSFKLIFTKKLDRAYILEYKSFINADDGESIENNAKIVGQSSGNINDEEKVQINVKLSGAGGGANAPGKGHLKIVKVDESTQSPLAGAVFGLYDSTGKQLLKQLVTDEQGVAVFENIKYKNYLLKELEAPAGYIIDRANMQGLAIAFKPGDAEYTLKNKKGQWNLELTKVDKEDPAKVLSNAEFKLQLDDGSGFQDVAGYGNLMTDANGKLLLADLRPGKYQLVEIRAPKGYKLDVNPISFTIEADQTVMKKIEAPNEAYIGSVSLLKVDQDSGAPLGGAQFDLYDGNGSLLQAGLTTDLDGKLLVDQLRAGSYQLVETKAPEKYILNAAPLDFEIVDDAVLSLVISNERVAGTLKLKKIETGNPSQVLPGAEFRILGLDMQPVLGRDGYPLPRLITDQNGEIDVPGLKPGKYYVEETKAPAGYTISTKPILIEIFSDEETVLTVENTRSTGGGGGGGNGSGGPGGNGEDDEGNNGNDNEGNNGNDNEGGEGDNGNPGSGGENGGSQKPDSPAVPGNTTGSAAPKPGQSNSKPVNTGNGASNNQASNSGTLLPKTGESRIFYQIAGYGSMILGAGLFLLARKRRLSE